MILSAEIAVHRPHSIGRRAARSGDFDVAVLALIRKANEHRKRAESLVETFVLVELAAIYQHLCRLDRLPALAKRVRKIEWCRGLPPEHAAIVRIAAELIESSAEDPAGLKIFVQCWPGDPT